MERPEPDHYATLGLEPRCTAAQIRTAFRNLVRQHHPDRNAGSAEAVARAQELNAAYEVLGDAVRRRAYDADRGISPMGRGGKIARNIAHDVRLRLEDFLRGVSLDVRVQDPANPEGEEVYQLMVPAGTAPGARFRLARAGTFAGGFVQIRVRALPSARFKARGSDLRCDLRISARRATEGGSEMVQGLGGSQLRVQIPCGAARGEILRVPGEGLPNPRGGRGDLLVRLTYRPEVRVTRTSGW